MLTFRSRSAASIGEAMLEMAPVGDGLYRRGFAGDTFNTAWHMAQLLHARAPVRFATRIGADTLSDAFAAELTADGLDTSGLSRDPVRTMGLYMIELHGAERSFHYWRDLSAAKRLADDPAGLAAAISGCGLVHLSGITLAILSAQARETLLDVLRQAKTSGTAIAFDPNVRPRLWTSLDEARAAMSHLLGLVDIALPSFDDEQSTWGDTTPADTLARYAAAGVGEVAVKCGPGAVHVQADGQTSVLPTPAVSRIVDTTGAGDAFNAGYLACRLLGHAPVEAVHAGQALSSVVLGHHGARAPRDTVRAIAL
jgi:2-dehydro-3-deoxygluconokinase